MWVAATVLVLVATPGQEKPEELFKAMEAKIHKAKTVEMVQEIHVSGPVKAKVTLHIFLTEGNKVNVSVEIDMDGKKQGPFGIVSDGKSVKPFPAPGLATSEPAPKQLNEVLTTLLTRMQLVGINEKELLQRGFDRDKVLALSDFKLGAREKVGDKETQIIEYVVTVDNGKAKTRVPVKVWLDTTSLLPLKRVKKVEEDDKKVEVIEVFKELKLDTKIDAKKFELPKD